MLLAAASSHALTLSFSSLTSLYTTQEVHIIISDHLVQQPEPMLRAICAALNLPFQTAMLSWQAGPKPYDGVWAPWWYANTHRGTGFASAVQDSRKPLPGHLRQLLGECQALYRLLKRDALAPAPAGLEVESVFERVLAASPPPPPPAQGRGEASGVAAVAQQPLRPATAGPLQAHALGESGGAGSHAAMAAAPVEAAARKLPGSLQGTPAKQQLLLQAQQAQHLQQAAAHKAGTHAYEQDPR